MFKYLTFSAGKTAHLDRLCLENSLKEGRANVGQLCVCCKKKLYYDSANTNVLLLSLLQIMFKGSRNSYDNNVLFSCPLFWAM